jgi:hypothetical protein
VLVEAEPPRWTDGGRTPTAGHRWGPLVASQTRPVERLQLGAWSLPLAINTYTGGWPDWPARAAVALTGRSGAATVVHVAGGVGLLTLLWGALRSAQGRLAAGAAAVVLAGQWTFVFYRKVLGGTELALLGGVVLLGGGLLRGGRRGRAAVVLGLGLGVGAKLPFLLSAAAILGTAALAWLAGRSRGTTVSRARSESAGGLRWVVAVALLAVAPLVVTRLHHALAVPELPHVRSHDFPEVQWQRVLSVFSGEAGPAREQAGNIWRWAVAPLDFFSVAYSAPTVRPGMWLAGAGWLGWLGAWLHAWARESRTAWALRWTGLALLAQLGALGLVARDLHHLAQAAPVAAAAVGLAVAHAWERLRGPARGASLLLGAFPVAAGVSQLAATDTVVEQIPVPTFSASAQRELVDWLRAQDIERVVLCDYEAMGVIDVLAPELEVVQLWALASRRFSEDDVMDAFLEDVLSEARGGHLLLLRASAPMIYNLRTTEQQLAREAAVLGLQIELAAELPARDGGKPAARLFRVW